MALVFAELASNWPLAGCIYQWSRRLAGGTRADGRARTDRRAAIQNSASRVMISMARDGRPPGARRLARAHPSTGTPILTGVAVSVLAIAVLLINRGNPAAFAAVTSTSVVIVYLAYLLVTVPALRARLRRRDPLAGSSHQQRLPPRQEGGFSLGRWGLPAVLVSA